MTNNLLKISLLTILMVSCLVDANRANAQKHNVNCKAQYQFSKSQLDITANILQKVSAEVKLDPKLQGQVTEWTTVTLAQQGAVCSAYSQSTEQQFPTATYLSELDKLRTWDQQFLQMVLSYISTCQTKATKGTGPDAAAQAAASLKAGTERLARNLPTLQIPPTASKE
jgi:hypothetical protein